MLEKKNYTNGQEIYTFNEDKLTYFYKSGQIKAVGTYLNDQMEGEWLFYRETGQLWQIGNFLDNEKHGAWIRYNKDNQVEYNEQFNHGKLIKK